MAYAPGGYGIFSAEFSTYMPVRFPSLWILLGLASFSLRSQHAAVADSLLNRALYFSVVQLDSMREVSQQALRWARRGSDSFLLAEANEFVGNYYAEMAASDSVTHYLGRAEQLYARDTTRYATYYALSARAAIAQVRGDDPSALRISLKLLEECRRLHDDACMADAYWQVGSAFYYQDLHHEAAKYTHQALEWLRKDGDTLAYADGLIEYSESLRKQSDLAGAKTVLVEARDLLQSFDAPVLTTKLYLQAGANHLAGGALELAESSLRTSLQQATRSGAHLAEAFALGYLGQLYLYRADYPTAVDYLRKSLTRPVRETDERYLNEQQRYLADAFAGLGQYDSAYHYSSVAERNYRLGVQQDHAQQLAALQVNFDTAEQERQIEEQRALLRWQRKQLYGVIGVALLFLTLGVVLTLLTRRLRRRNDENIQLVAQKETLIGEIHHRVKNNLQVISSLLQLQIRGLQAGDDRARSALLESQARVEAMGLIHQRLYQEGRDFNQVHMADYLRELGTSLVEAYRLHQRVRLVFDVEDTALDVDVAIPVGLIVNELISNSLKHAFPNAAEGNIYINLRQYTEEIMLQVSDDGIGQSSLARQHQKVSFGTTLINLLSKKLHGRVRALAADSYGTEVRFPYPAVITGY